MDFSRLLEPFRALVRSVLQEQRVDYFRPFRAQVVFQDKGTLLLDVQPDDPTMPSMSGVPIRRGGPGETYLIATGATVMLAFENGDPARPYCYGWEGGESVVSIVLTADSISIGGTPAQPTILGTSYRTSEATANNALAAAFTALAGASTGPLAPLAAGFTAAAAALQAFEAGAAGYLATSAKVK